MKNGKSPEREDFATARLDADGHRLEISALIADRPIFAIVAAVPEEERDDFLLRALKVGILALRDSGAVAKTDYVDKEFQRMVADFEAQMSRYFGEEGEVLRALEEAFGDEGRMHQKIKAFFGDGGRFEVLMEQFLGEEGKLQSTMDASIGEDGAFHAKLEEFFGEDGRLRREMDREFGEDGGRLYRLLNPDDEKTPLGQFKKVMDERFDPDRRGSALWKLREQITKEFGEIKEGLGIKAAIEEERERGTAKGKDLEGAALDAITKAAAPFGDQVEDVSTEQGTTDKTGDVTSTLNAADTRGAERRIVFEAKNKPISLKGKNSIHRELESAISNRSAHFAIGVVHAAHATTFGPLMIVGERKALVAFDPDADESLPLVVAYRVARAFVLRQTDGEEAEIDVARIHAHVNSIKGQLETVQAMKKALTGTANNLERVKSDLDSLRESILGSLSQLIEELQVAA